MQNKKFAYAKDNSYNLMDEFIITLKFCRGIIHVVHTNFINTLTKKIFTTRIKIDFLFSKIEFYPIKVTYYVQFELIQ
jgi:hypothetical protein